MLPKLPTGNPDVGLQVCRPPEPAEEDWVGFERHFVRNSAPLAEPPPMMSLSGTPEENGSEVPLVAYTASPVVVEVVLASVVVDDCLGCRPYLGCDWIGGILRFRQKLCQKLLQASLKLSPMQHELEFLLLWVVDVLR